MVMSSAQVYRFNDYNIVEFTTKANAFDYDSMDALEKGNRQTFNYYQ
jgi:3-hydroxyacyl-CoA dehydrogenase